MFHSERVKFKVDVFEYFKWRKCLFDLNENYFIFSAYIFSSYNFHIFSLDIWFDRMYFWLTLRKHTMEQRTYWARLLYHYSRILYFLVEMTALLYVKIIKDMYAEATTQVRSTVGTTGKSSNWKLVSTWVRLLVPVCLIL